MPVKIKVGFHKLFPNYASVTFFVLFFKLTRTFIFDSFHMSQTVHSILIDIRWIYKKINKYYVKINTKNVTLT